MNEIVQLVYDRAGIIVTRGLDEYGVFSSEKDKVTFYGIAVDLLLTVTRKIENNDYVSVSPIKPLITESLFTLGFNYDTALAVFESVVGSLYREFDESKIIDPDIVNIYKKYEVLLRESLADVRILLRNSLPEYLSEIPEYRDIERNMGLGVTNSRLLIANRNTKVPPVSVSRLRTKFTSVFGRNLDTYASIISNASPDINAITSDSKVPEPLDNLDTDMLVATFSGEGKKIYQDIVKLHEFYVEFGGYEGSLTGSVEYQFRYYEYLMAMCYGKRLPQGVLGEEFGEFGDIYERKVTPEFIPGLAFLETLYTTRSANQNTDNVNPLALKYADGITDRYVVSQEKVGGKDFVSLALESVYVLCLKTGDYINALLKRPPEGIGNTIQQLSVLAKVFPSSLDIRERSTGLTGSIGSLLTSYRSLYALLGYKPDLHDFNEKFNTLYGLVSELLNTIRLAGFRPGEYVPSMELTRYEPDINIVKSKLKSLGFNETEIQDITGVSTFSELLQTLAPLTDSQDVISFFRAYDLTKLIYEFGGQQAIEQYVNFLYGVDENSTVLRLLEFLEDKRSLSSRVVGSEYSKLIGYLVTLTYAIDPDQLLKLNSILKLNNLNLFESITFILQGGEKTALKSSDDISLLSGMVSQMVVPDNKGYEYQKPTWNALIQESAGNIGPSVAGLYNRAEGITPTELYAALGGPSATSPLGKILDGVKGGRMTSLLRYCNLFGLLYTLSGYRNSGQLINRSADDYVLILEMLDTMEELTERLYVTGIILDESSTGDKTQQVYSDPLVQAQNKEFAALTNILENTADDFDINSYNISESPGTGNARIPNGVRIDNSLTPEEAALISTRGANIGAFTQQYSAESGSYVRVAVSNLLANGVVIDEGQSIGVSGNTGDQELLSAPISDYDVSYAPLTGSTTTSTGPASPFDPIKSCIKFGTTDCVSRGYGTSLLCSKGENKSLFPETGYGTDPLNGSGGVQIDRALGQNMEQSTKYNSVSLSHPQRYFTINGLTEASRSALLKDNEMLCASIQDPYEYGACMSLLKCKKFLPPYAGRYDFAWCPTSLHGGRYRK